MQLDRNYINDLKKYIEKNIFPKYDKFYSHGMIYINNVIDNMLMLADYYKFCGILVAVRIILED